MTTSTKTIEEPTGALPERFWTVESDYNEYGPFETHDAAANFVRRIGGGTISACRDMRLVRSVVMTKEEFEEFERNNPTEVLLDPAEYGQRK